MPAAMRRIGPESLDESSRADLAMAFALGFRSPATLLDWLGVIGIIAAAAFAAAWLTVALGMAAKTPQSAGLAVVPLILLPFLNSAIVPAATMGQGARQFAQYQPFTPIIESFLLGRTRPRAIRFRRPRQNWMIGAPNIRRSASPGRQGTVAIRYRPS
jgi:hypothetical protein